MSLSYEFSVFDILVAVSGISLSLAGLASIISLFKNGENFNREDVLLFRSIIQICLCIILGTLLPAVILLGLNDIQVMWRLCCFIYSLVASYILIQAINQIRKKELKLLYPWPSWLVFVISFLLIIQALVASLTTALPANYILPLIGGILSVCVRLYLFLIDVTTPVLDRSKK